MRLLQKARQVTRGLNRGWRSPRRERWPEGCGGGGLAGPGVPGVGGE